MSIRLTASNSSAVRRNKRKREPGYGSDMIQIAEYETQQQPTEESVESPRQARETKLQMTSSTVRIGGQLCASRSDFYKRITNYLVN